MSRAADAVRSLMASLALVGLGDAAACGKTTAPAFVEMQVTQPLIAVPGGDLSLRVGVREDGCVLIHYPAYDSRHGDYAFRLAEDELRGLRTDLAATGIARFDPVAVAQDLQRRETIKRSQPDAVRHRVSDEAVVELWIEKPSGPKGARNTVTWSGIREQLLNHPDLAPVAGLAAARDRLLRLGEDPRMRKVQP
jgi:hypothetical protein